MTKRLKCNERRTGSKCQRVVNTVMRSKIYRDKQEENGKNGGNHYNIEIKTWKLDVKEKETLETWEREL